MPEHPWKFPATVFRIIRKVELKAEGLGAEAIILIHGGPV